MRKHLMFRTHLGLGLGGPVDLPIDFYIALLQLHRAPGIFRSYLGVYLIGKNMKQGEVSH